MTVEQVMARHPIVPGYAVVAITHENPERAS